MNGCYVWNSRKYTLRKRLKLISELVIIYNRQSECRFNSFCTYSFISYSASESWPISSSGFRPKRGSITRFHRAAFNSLLCKLAYEFAVVNKISHRFNVENKTASNTWIRSFLKRRTLMHRTSEKCSIARTMEFNRPQVNSIVQQLRKMSEGEQYFCQTYIQCQPNRFINSSE